MQQVMAFLFVLFCIIFLLLLPGKDLYTDLSNAALFHAQHSKADVFIFHHVHLSIAGQEAELARDEAAERVVIALRQVRSDQLINLVEIRRAIDGEVVSLILEISSSSLSYSS